MQEQIGAMGLGKGARDAEVLDNTALNPRQLASFKMANETDADKEKREVSFRLYCIASILTLMSSVCCCAKSCYSVIDRRDSESVLLRAM